MSFPSLIAVTLQPAAAYTMSAGRLGASTAALLGLAGAIVGGLALARSDARSGKGQAIVGLTAGLVSMALGGLVVATSEGGVGTGNGLGGAYVALAVGLISTVLGGLLLARAR